MMDTFQFLFEKEKGNILSFQEVKKKKMSLSS